MLSAGDFDSKYSFPITGVSYIGRPKDNTAMFCVKKLEHMLTNLEQTNQCLVFIEEGMQPSPELLGRHGFVYSENPAAQYGHLTKRLWDAIAAAQAKRRYTQHEAGYVLGENVTIGQNVTIEPGVLVDHDVTIGDGCVLLAGAKVRNAAMGVNCMIKENAVVGDLGFTQYEGEDGSWHRLYNFGRVVLGNNVEVGACANVCRGSADNTVVGDDVRLDDHVYIAHDVNVGDNVRIAANTTVGGYTSIGQRCFIGFAATLRNRIQVGQDTTIGMGSVVTKDVPAGVTAYGSPAKVHEA